MTTFESFQSYLFMDKSFFLRLRENKNGERKAVEYSLKLRKKEQFELPLDKF